MPDPGWWEALWPDPAKVLRDVGVTPGRDVVDLCCGDGWFTFPLSRIARSVIAIDIDAALLDAAKVRIAERGGTPNCTFVEADAYDVAEFAPPRLTMCSSLTPSTAFQTSRALRKAFMTFSSLRACSLS